MLFLHCHHPRLQEPDQATFDKILCRLAIVFYVSGILLSKLLLVLHGLQMVGDTQYLDIRVIFSCERKVTDHSFIYGVVWSNGWKVFIRSPDTQRDFAV